MAKRRKKAHHASKRRTHHRKSHLGGLDVADILLLVGGAVAAGLLDKVIPATIDPKIVAAGKIAIGVVLPMVAKDGKTKSMLAAAGHGFIAVGSLDLMNGLGILSGAADGDDLLIQLNGSESILAGAEDLSIVNGSADILAGDDLSIVNGMMGDGY